MTASECIHELGAEKAMMISASTGGVRIQEANSEYFTRRLRIHEFLSSVAIPDPNPYSDLWAWHGKWSDGELPTYKSRREYLKDLFDSTFNSLKELGNGKYSDSEPARTGWLKIDRVSTSIRAKLEIAKDEEEFQTIGLLCRENLI